MLLLELALLKVSENNKIWDNSAIWGKAIFKDFRDIIKKFKIPEDQQKDVNKDEVLRNVLFNRFMFYIDKLSYFDMYRIGSLKSRFTYFYKFTLSQQSIMNKADSDDEPNEYDIDQHFSEEVKIQRSSGSITKHMGKWMNKLEKLSVSAVTKMKTYIKKKEIEEDSVIDQHDELNIDEYDHVNLVSTDASKDNSEASPPKDMPGSVKKEVEVEKMLDLEEDISPEKLVVEDSELINQTIITQ
jgi:hypothetical protein